MNSQSQKIKEFKDLKTWQESHKALLTIYSLTKNFPKDEAFGLTSQLRRAAVSVTSNIAEGFGRQGMKEKIHFYYLAQGSLTEVKNQLLLARDVSYLSSAEYESVSDQLNSDHQLLQGLITKSKTFLSSPLLSHKS